MRNAEKRGWRAAILIYHGLEDGPASGQRGTSGKYVLSFSRFREQLDWIERSQTQLLALSAFWRSESAQDGKNQAVLTFDDGSASDYDLAFSQLHQRGLPGTFFLNSGTVGTRGRLSWPQVVEMQRHGMTMGSHGHDHIFLTRLPAREMARQLVRSKQIIEDRTGERVDFFAGPYGDINARVVDAALEAGYSAVCTSANLRAMPGEPTIPRVAVYAATTTTGVARLVEGRSLSYSARQARRALLYLPKQVILSLRLRNKNWLPSQEDGRA